MRQLYPVASSRDPPKSENADAYTTLGCCPLGRTDLKKLSTDGFFVKMIGT